MTAFAGEKAQQNYELMNRNHKHSRCLRDTSLCPSASNVIGKEIIDDQHFNHMVALENIRTRPARIESYKPRQILVKKGITREYEEREHMIREKHLALKLKQLQTHSKSRQNTFVPSHAHTHIVDYHSIGKRSDAPESSSSFRRLNHSKSQPSSRPLSTSSRASRKAVNSKDSPKNTNLSAKEPPKQDHSLKAQVIQLIAMYKLFTDEQLTSFFNRLPEIFPSSTAQERWLVVAELKKELRLADKA